MQRSEVGTQGDDSVPAVELIGMAKRFPGVIANRDVNLTLGRARIHALIGENGAGKSTLMKSLYGMHRPDEGEMRIDGHRVDFRSPQDAMASGIGMVHQHFMLADHLTVLENIVLGAEPTRRGLIDRERATSRIRDLAVRYGLTVEPTALVETLNVGDRQRVEILKVLYRDAQILVLDEPTTVLVPHEVEALFSNLRVLTREGVTVLLTSHKLDEVLSIADHVTVMRRGTTVVTLPAGDVTARELAELMVGDELPAPAQRDDPVSRHAVLHLEGITVHGADARPALDEVSLTVHSGEILGVAGVEGNGQAELVEAVMGIRPLAGGTIHLEGEAINGWSTRARRRRGLGYIPEDRHRQGLLLEAPLWENRILGHQTERPNARGWLLDRAAAREDTKRIISDYDVRTHSPDVTAASLSGGNQQKLIFGREMSAVLKVLIASHPTRGVDVGAQHAIWNHLRTARGGGLGVLLVSADLDELIALSDRIVVILRGRLVATVSPDSVTPRELGSAMTGVRP